MLRLAEGDGAVRLLDSEGTFSHNRGSQPRRPIARRDDAEGDRRIAERLASILIAFTRGTHGDVKPENVLLPGRKPDRAVLIDFDTARRGGRVGTALSTAFTARATDGIGCGSRADVCARRAALCVREWNVSVRCRYVTRPSATFVREPRPAPAIAAMSEERSPAGCGRSSGGPRGARGERCRPETLYAGKRGRSEPLDLDDASRDRYARLVGSWDVERKPKSSRTSCRRSAFAFDVGSPRKRRHAVRAVLGSNRSPAPPSSGTTATLEGVPAALVAEARPRSRRARAFASEGQPLRAAHDAVARRGSRSEAASDATFRLRGATCTGRRFRAIALSDSPSRHARRSLGAASTTRHLLAPCARSAPGMQRPVVRGDRRARDGRRKARR
jgi:hypothetical protein